jgi:hypothetical protein
MTRPPVDGGEAENGGTEGETGGETGGKETV